MPLLHDPAVHDAILSRLNGLRADSRGRWGKMTVDQMLWHVNEGLEAALGRVTPEPMKFPLPPRVLRFMLLNFPWMKGAPTNPRFLARATHDFDAERERCRRLLAEISAVPIETFGINHPVLGRMSGRENSRLHANTSIITCASSVCETRSPACCIRRQGLRIASHEGEMKEHACDDGCWRLS